MHPTSALYFTDFHARTCLHFACYPPRSETPYSSSPSLTVSTLINLGADVDACDHNGQTPLHYAAVNLSPEAVGALIKSFAKTDAKDCKGRTPLHCTLYHANRKDNQFQSLSRLLKTTDLLILANPKVAHICDSYSMTPIGYACISSSLLLIESLFNLSPPPPTPLSSTTPPPLIKQILLTSVHSGSIKVLR